MSSPRLLRLRNNAWAMCWALVGALGLMSKLTTAHAMIWAGIWNVLLTTFQEPPCTVYSSRSMHRSTQSHKVIPTSDPLPYFTLGGWRTRPLIIMGLVSISIPAFRMNGEFP